MSGWRPCKTCGGHRLINSISGLCKTCGNDPDAETLVVMPSEMDLLMAGEPVRQGCGFCQASLAGFPEDAEYCSPSCEQQHQALVAIQPQPEASEDP